MLAIDGAMDSQVDEDLPFLETTSIFKRFLLRKKEVISRRRSRPQSFSVSSDSSVSTCSSSSDCHHNHLMLRQQRQNPNPCAQTGDTNVHETDTEIELEEDEDNQKTHAEDIDIGNHSDAVDDEDIIVLSNLRNNCQQLVALDDLPEEMAEKDLRNAVRDTLDSLLDKLIQFQEIGTI